MVKSIIKEIIIIMLLLLAVILALGVLFYDYIPTNKLVPSIDTYTTAESVKAELNEQVTNEETVLVTYEITESDLSTYAKTNQYKKGKANPFSTYEDPEPVNQVDENGNPKYSEEEMHSFLENATIGEETIIDEDGNEIVTPKIVFPNDSRISKKDLAGLDMRTIMETIRLPKISTLSDEQAIKLAESSMVGTDGKMMFDESRFGDVEGLEEFEGLELGTITDKDKMTMEQSLENYKVVEQMQIEVAARFKYQLALELESQVQNLQDRMEEYRRAEKDHILTADAEKEYKKLRAIAAAKVEQLSHQGLAEVEQRGHDQYLKVCEKARSLLGEPLKAVDPLRTVTEQHRKTIKDTTGRE